jgi:hypothetical protein
MQSLPSVFIFTAISVANSRQDNLAVEPKKKSLEKSVVLGRFKRSSRTIISNFCLIKYKYGRYSTCVGYFVAVTHVK